MEPMSELEQVDLLTGPGAGTILEAALGTEGATIMRWEVHALHHRPSAGVSVGYTLQVRDSGGAEASQYVCATTSRLTDERAPGLVRLDHPSGRVTVHVWRHPHDPELPALPPACDARTMSRALGRDVTVHMVAYRPTRRCVLKLSDGEAARAFVKVVRPRVLPDLVGRHELLTEAGVPAPRVLHHDPDGLVVLSPASGTPLANFLARGLDDPVATFDAAMSVLDRLPAGVLSLKRHPSWSERVDHYAHAAATALPERAEQARWIAAAVSRAMHDADAGPVVPTHGDWYEANIFMADPTAVSSILDVDSVGPGHRVDDIACLLGHVSVLPHLAPDVYPHVPAILDAWWERAIESVDARSLAARSAAVTLSLVAGARNPADDDSWREDALGRADEAARWLGRAGQSVR